MDVWLTYCTLPILRKQRINNTCKPQRGRGVPKPNSRYALVFTTTSSSRRIRDANVCVLNDGRIKKSGGKSTAAPFSATAEKGCATRQRTNALPPAGFLPLEFPAHTRHSRPAASGAHQRLERRRPERTNRKAK